MRRLFKYLAFFAVIATSCVKSPNNGTLEEHSAVTGEFLEGNRIEITAEEEDVYTLVYEDGAAKPLADFAPICVLDYSKLNYYKDFIDINIAPREAESIGIYDSKGDGAESLTYPLSSLIIPSNQHIVSVYSQMYIWEKQRSFQKKISRMPLTSLSLKESSGPASAEISPRKEKRQSLRCIRILYPKESGQSM